jgi:hypothetical protein
MSHARNPVPAIRGESTRWVVWADAAEKSRLKRLAW